MNTYIQNILSMRLTNYNEYVTKAYDSIYKNLFVYKNWGNNKLSDIDEYDSEVNTYKRIIPGSVYMFLYKSKSIINYKFNDIINFEYSDNLPLVLCIKKTDKTIQGINLNICNFALRTLILNDIYNLDLDYFTKNAEIMASKKIFPISLNISNFFLNDNNILQYYKLIKEKYKLHMLKYIIRTYSISNISNIRFIEPWQWKYIPFLLYNSIKDNILKIILKITNIDKINI